MARTRSISSIDAEISKLEDELSKVQEKYDALAARILELQKQKQTGNGSVQTQRKKHAGIDEFSGCLICNLAFSGTFVKSSQ